MRDLMLEYACGQPTMTARRAILAAHPMEQVGERLRAMMPWIAKDKQIDKARN